MPEELAVPGFAPRFLQFSRLLHLQTPVPAQNSISGEILGLRRVPCDEMHELSRTPTIPIAPISLGSWCSPWGFYTRWHDPPHLGGRWRSLI